MYIKVGVGKSGCSGEEVALEKGGREGEGGVGGGGGQWCKSCMLGFH